MLTSDLQTRCLALSLSSTYFDLICNLLKQFYNFFGCSDVSRSTLHIQVAFHSVILFSWRVSTAHHSANNCVHLSEKDQTRRDQEVGSKSQKATRLYYWLISKSNNQYFDHKTSVLTLFCLIVASTDAFSGILRTISYFDFPTLKKATNNFHQGNLLGSGGFGPVYRVLFMNLWS